MQDISKVQLDNKLNFMLMGFFLEFALFWNEAERHRFFSSFK